MLRHRLVLLLALGFTAGIAAQWNLHARWPVPAAIALAGLLLAAAGKGRWAAVGIVIIGAGLGGLRLYGLLPPGSNLAAYAGDAPATLQGTVITEPVRRPFSTSFTLHVSVVQSRAGAGGVDGRISVLVHGAALANITDLHCGARITAMGILQPVMPATNPGQFDFQAQEEKQGISAELVVQREEGILQVSTAAPSLSSTAVDSRLTAIFAKSMPPVEAALITGIVFGQRSGIPQTLKNEFVRTGTVHILATAGLHVAIVAVCLLWLLGRLGAPPKLSSFLTILCLTGYALLAGGRPSVTRAVLMACLILGGRLVERAPDLTTSFAAAALVILALQPTALFESGFQLSFVTVAGIILLMPIWSAVWASPLEAIPHPVLKSGCRLAVELTGLSFCAQVCAAPLVAYYYFQISLLGAAANLVVVPLLFAVLPLSLAAMFAGALLPWLGGWICILAVHPFAWLIVNVVHGFAGLPLSAVPVSPPPPLLVCLFYTALFGLAGSYHLRKWIDLPGLKRAMSAAVPLLLLLLITVSCGSTTAAHTLRVTVLDVGQGDSIVVQTPGGHVLLIDGGGAIEGSGNTDGAGVGDTVVVPFLRYEGVRTIDVLLLTHPHSDHVGGLPAVLQALPVADVMDGAVLPLPTSEYRTFLQLIRQQHIPYQRARRGEHLDFGDGVTGDILSPPQSGRPFGVDHSNKTINNYSAVLRLTYGTTHILLDGDAEAEAEANMMAAYPAASLQADVLKVGHHGARNASSAAWLATVHPRAAIISCGRHNPFGHPHIETLQRLNAQGITIYRTDQDGAVTIISDGVGVKLTRFLSKNAL